MFRVIGYNAVGLGHIYRSLTLAHEFYDHEIIFVTDEKSRTAVDTLLKKDYWLATYKTEQVIDKIVALQADLVIFDALDTRRRDIEEIRNAGAIVISFEDLGSGVGFTDLTINEIYEPIQIPGKKILWGHNYFFLRDEFQAARPPSF